MSDVQTDAGYFAIVPEWVLDTASPNAVKIYGLLRRYADKESQDAYPSRRTLARRMGFSRPASVDPAIAELVHLGAVQVTARHSKRGDQDSNAYLVITVPPAHIVRVEVEKDFFMWVVRESGLPRTPERTGGGTPQRTTGGTRTRTTPVRESGHESESPEPESLEPEIYPSSETQPQTRDGDDDGPVDNPPSIEHPAAGQYVPTSWLNPDPDGEHWDVPTVRACVEATTGRIASNGDLFEIVATIRERAARKRTRIGDLTAYVCTSIRGDPFAWQQLLDRRGEALDVTA